MPVGIAQRRAFGGSLYAQMPQFALARRQATSDFPQALGVAQLAEQHRDELRPTGKAPRVPLGLMLADRRLEFQARDQLQNLTEDTAFSIQGGVSVRWYWFLANPNPTYRGFHPSPQPQSTCAWWVKCSFGQVCCRQ